MRRLGNKASVAQLHHEADKTKAWPESALAKAEAQWKRQQIRRLLEQAVDDEGVRVYFHVQNYVQGDLADLYVHEELCTEDEYRQIQDFYYRDGRYKRGMGDLIRGRCYSRYGILLPNYDEWSYDNPKDTFDDPGYTKDPDDDVR